MQIPEHWAEARLVGTVNGRKRVVRRFGWSVVSAAEAELRAQERAAAALAELQAGRQVAQREQKLPYGGEGLPIREQVLARHGDVVITRNSYGAHCLNEPDVLFADIDMTLRLPRAIATAQTIVMLAVMGLTIAVGVWSFRLHSCATLPAMAIVFLGCGAPIERAFDRKIHSVANRDRCLAPLRDVVRSVVTNTPGSRATVYETPNGLRVLMLHATYDPRSEATQQLLGALSTDPAYMQMCALQACFRARVSGKPWRMGVRHIVPNPGIWPVHPDRRDRRERWIAEYEAAAAGYAACRFLEDLGGGPVHPRCAEVQRLHDELSGARSGKPIA